MQPADIATHFAPAGRDTPLELRHKQAVLRETPLVQSLIDALPGVVMILNANRQVVAVNQALLDVLAVPADAIVGKRTGEIIGCTRPQEGPDGCGTARHCLTCGAVSVILESQHRQGKITRECRVTLAKPIGAALDLRVTAAGIEIGGERFVVCSVEDIGPQKRLAVLTRMFFHDVLNVVGGIKGYLYGLERSLRLAGPDKDEFQSLSALADQLVDEIESHRDLVRAESGELEVQPQSAPAAMIVDDVLRIYSAHPAAAGREVCREEPWPGFLVTDVQLAARVLGNMLLNALEACPAGGSVGIGCREEDGYVVFHVANPGVMPEEVQLQIFQRSFSTKGQPGRGLGTHTMKLFGERYLRGRVAFRSRDPEGTVFTLSLPKVLSPDEDGEADGGLR